MIMTEINPIVRLRHSDRGHFRLLISGILLMICSLPGMMIAQPTSGTVVSKDYQNLMRARRLLEMESEIVTMPDARIRGHLRLKVLKFVFSKGVQAEYAAGEALLTTMFEDMARNEKEVALCRGLWSNQLALLLRKHAPDIGRRFEAKYVKDVDTTPLDEDDLKAGAAPGMIADRLIERIHQGDRTGSMSNIHDAIKRRDAAAAERLLSTLIERREKHPDPTQLNVLYWAVDGPNRKPGDTPLELSLRYYRLLVKAALTDDGKIANDGRRYFPTEYPLNAAMPKIKEMDTDLYRHARAAVERRRKRLPDLERQKGMIADRVAESDDPMAAWIAEGEKANDPRIKDHAYFRASALARQKQLYKTAVDLLIRGSPNLSYPAIPNNRDRWIYYMIMDAARKRDIESVEYAIKHLQDPNFRGDATLYAAGEIGRREQAKRADYAAMILRGFDELENATIEAQTICSLGNSVNDWIRFQPAGALRAAEIRARAIAIANRVPLPDPAAKPGSPERIKYVEKVLAPGLGCIAWLVQPVPGAHVPLVPFELADGVKIREWNLAARIQNETRRTYPSPTN